MFQAEIVSIKVRCSRPLRHQVLEYDAGEFLRLECQQRVRIRNQIPNRHGLKLSPSSVAKMESSNRWFLLRRRASSANAPSVGAIVLGGKTAVNSFEQAPFDLLSRQPSDWCWRDKHWISRLGRERGSLVFVSVSRCVHG